MGLSVSHWVDQCVDLAPITRLSAIPALVALAGGSLRARKALVSLLNDPSVKVRWVALEALCTTEAGLSPVQLFEVVRTLREIEQDEEFDEEVLPEDDTDIEAAFNGLRAKGNVLRAAVAKAERTKDPFKLAVCLWARKNLWHEFDEAYVEKMLKLAAKTKRAELGVEALASINYLTFMFDALPLLRHSSAQVRRKAAEYVLVSGSPARRAGLISDAHCSPLLRALDELCQGGDHLTILQVACGLVDGLWGEVNDMGWIRDHVTALARRHDVGLYAPTAQLILAYPPFAITPDTRVVLAASRGFIAHLIEVVEAEDDTDEMLGLELELDSVEAALTRGGAAVLAPGVLEPLLDRLDHLDEHARRRVVVLLAALAGTEEIPMELRTQSRPDDKWLLPRKGTVDVFAYGSNMSPGQMKERVPAAEPVGVARLIGCEVVFNKASKDGTGKANLRRTPTGRGAVFGVVWRMNLDGLNALDSIEGSGYERRWDVIQYLPLRVEPVRSPERSAALVETYVALPKAVRDGLQPSREYWGRVLEGAKWAKLSDRYIEKLSGAAGLGGSE
jgi:gamma-glutamylcyclotransferase